MDSYFKQLVEFNTGFDDFFTTYPFYNEDSPRLLRSSFGRSPTSRRGWNKKRKAFYSPLYIEFDSEDDEISYNDLNRRKQLKWNKTKKRGNARTFSQSLDLKDYDPEEVEVKMANGAVEVSSSSCQEKEGHFSTKQMYHRFTLPKNVSKEDVKISFNDSGVLSITEDKQKELKKIKSYENTKATMELKNDENERGNELKTIENKSIFKQEVDVSGYDPSELSVKLINGTVEVAGLSVKEEDGARCERRIRKTFPIPKDVHEDDLHSFLDNNGILRIASEKSCNEEPVVQRFTLGEENKKENVEMIELDEKEI
ncbi:unnamed protein product [Dimorphilus gyrociliatus]|uniref:SHSP domain-containing protein n=1 Tax=Dimorphilus gyrociliatus TaxID=2664684 RepID=A0A7I8VK52_9ANNE|nr:unnamed protein product [Dimorphilus gyrociliatus]